MQLIRLEDTVKEEPCFHKWEFDCPAGTTAVGKLCVDHKATFGQTQNGMTVSMDGYLPQPRGAGRSYVNEAIKSLSDDEVVRCFKNARMADKVVFLHEIQRRGIKSITIDLEGEVTDDMLMNVMETGTLFGEPIDNSYVAAMLKEETCMMERFQKKAVVLDPLASHSPDLTEKKKPKFYQELNKNSRGKHRR